MLLLDTCHVPPAERAQAFDDTVIGASVPSSVTHEDPGRGVCARIEAWEFGTATLFRTTSSGFRLHHTEHHPRSEAPPAVAVAMQPAGVSSFAQAGRQEMVGAGDLILNDLSTPYEFGWTGTGTVQCLQAGYDALGLPADVVRAGAERLRTSPLYEPVRRHLAELCADADRLSADPGAPALGTATVGLLRALVESAASSGAAERPLPERSLLDRVLAHTRTHLTEPGLTPARIAADHNMSVRCLYRMCAGAGIALEQWIIAQRLEGARATLSSPAGAHRQIGSVARAWGFADPSHFARRFRAAYGVAPREWQRAVRRSAG